MKKKNVVKRILAIVLVVVMVASGLPDMGLTAYAADTSNAVADSSTAMTYETMLGDETEGNRYSGRVWVDKSVYTYDTALGIEKINDSEVTNDAANANEFQVMFSALGSSTAVSTDKLVGGYMDVVLVLDISASMGRYVSGNTTRLEMMVDATNKLVNQILQTDTNQVAIVTYGKGAETLLELGHHEPASGATNILSLPYINKPSATNDGGVKVETGYAIVQAATSSGTTRQNCYYQGTNLQAGIAQGMGLLADRTATQVSGRTPVVIVLTDGVADYGMNSRWWRTDTIESSSLNTQPSNAIMPSSNTITSGVALSTLLNAAYMKSAVELKYGQDSCTVYGVSVDLELGSDAFVVMDPANNFKADGTTLAQNAYSSYQSWKNGSTVSHTDEIRRSWTFAQLPGVGNDYQEYAVTKTMVEDNINYVDTHYTATSAGLSEIFDEIYQSMSEKAFNPLDTSKDVTDTTTGTETSTSTPLIYVDNIGQYMEVTGIQKVLLFGQEYAVNTTPTAVTTKDKDGNVVTGMRYGVVSGNGTNPATSETWDLTSDMDIIIVDNSDGSQSLYIYITNQALIPIILDTLEVTQTDGTYTATYTEKTQTPLRVLYTVGLQSGLVNAAGQIDLSQIDADYLAEHYDEDNGKIYFYTNEFGVYGTDANDTLTHGDAHVGFVASKDNRYYYHQTNQPIYNAVTYENGTSIKENALKDNHYGILWQKNEVEVVTLKMDPMTFAELLASNTTTDAFTIATFWAMEDATADTSDAYHATWVIYTPLGNLATDLVFGFEQNGAITYLNYDAVNDTIVLGEEGLAYDSTMYQNYIAAVNTWISSNSYGVTANSLYAYLSVGSLRVPRLANMTKDKEKNETGTAPIAYAPEYNENHDEANDMHEHSEIIVWLGNNGKLTFDAVQPKIVMDGNADPNPTVITDVAEIDGQLVAVNDKLMYLIQATNSHSEAATIKITDTLPVGTALVDNSIKNGVLNADGTITWAAATSGTYDADTETITWEISNVAAGATVVVRFEVVVVESAVLVGKLENAATVEIPAANNSYTTNMTINPVTGKRVADQTGAAITDAIQVGDYLEYSIAYFNDGAEAATITITDKIPQGTTFVEASHGDYLTKYNAAGVSVDGTTDTVASLKWELTNIQPGTGGVVTFEVQVNASIAKDSGETGLDVENNATITYPNDPNIVTNTTNTEVGTGDLVLTKTVTGKENDTKSFELVLTERTGLLNDTYTTTNGSTTGTVTFVNGKATVTIKHDETITIQGLPANVYITVTETASTGYTASYDGSNEVAITANASEAVKVNVTNAYQAVPTSLVLKGVKNFINQEPTSQTRTFYFTLQEADENGNVKSARATDLQATTSITVAAKADNTGTFTFAQIHYSQAGVYYYLLSEVNDGAEGMLYDQSQYLIKVVVSDVNAQLTTAVSWKLLSPTATDYTNVTVSNNTAALGTRFTNMELHTSVNLVGKKTLNNATLKDNQFAFVVDEVVGTEYVRAATGQNSADGTITFTTLNYHEAGTHIYRVTEVTGTDTSMTYSAAEYYVKVVVTMEASGLVATTTWCATNSSNTEDWKVLTDNTTLQFTNVYDPGYYTVKLEATKELTGRALVADEFDFEVLYDTNRVDVGSNASNGTITFAGITYQLSDLTEVDANTKKGTFEYTIREVTGTDSHITYSKEVYTATVEITYSNTDGWSHKITYSDDAVFTNTYKPSPVSYQPEGVTKTVTSSGALPEKLSFAFEVIKAAEAIAPDKSVIDDGYKVGDRVGYGVSKQTGTGTESNGTYSSTTEVTFSELTFYRPGTYKAWLKEVIPTGSTHGVTYDQSRYLMEIVVSQDTDGELEVNVTYYALKEGGTVGSDTPSDYTTPVEDSSGVVDITFTNSYNAKGTLVITATKNLIGKARVEGEFDFELVGPNGVVHVGTNDADGNIVFDTLVYDSDDLKSSPITYTMREVKGKLPGVIYDAKEYTVTVALTNAGGGKITATPTITLNNESAEAVFTNIYYSDFELVIPLAKTLTGRDMVANEFGFVMTDDKNNIVNVAYAGAAKAGVSATVTLKAKISAAVGVDPRTTYTYYITEQTGSVPGVTYDGAKYKVMITVTDGNQDGTLEYGAPVVEKWNGTDWVDADKVHFENDYTPEAVDINLAGYKTLVDTSKDEAVALQNGEFDFELYEIQRNKDTGAIEQKTLKAVGTNDANGVITFTTITLNTKGSYEYQIVEDKTGNIRGVSYDDTVYTVIVNVTDDGNGKLVAEIGVGVGEKNGNNTMLLAWYNSELTGEQAQIRFDNKYTPESGTFSFANVTKKLDGREMNEGEFTFYATLTGYKEEENGTVSTNFPANAVVRVIGSNDKNGAVVFAPINYTTAGYYYYTIKEVAVEAPNVTMDQSEYLVEVIVKDNGGKLQASVGTILQTKNADGTDANSTAANSGIVFTNKYVPNPITVPVQVYKNLTGRVLNDKEFEFALKYGDIVIASGKNDAKGNIVFDYGLNQDGIVIKEKGTYEYIITEDGGDLHGVKYDKTVLKVKIVVSDDNLGTLTPTVTYEAGVTFQNVYTPDPIQVPIDMLMRADGAKILNGREMIDEEFKFEVKDLEGNLVAIGYSQEDGKIKFDYDLSEVGIQTDNLETTDVVEAGITFKTAGTYRFSITEIVEDSAQITYDPAVWYIQISVVQDLEEGKLVLNSSVDGDGLMIIEARNSSANTADGVVFTNTYDPVDAVVSLVGTKTMTGHRTDVKAGEFQFQLLDKENKVVAEGTTDAYGNILFGELVYTQPGEYEYTLVEVKGSAKGMTYDETKYTVVVVVEERMDDGKYLGQLSATANVNGAAYDATKIQFTNKYTADPALVTIVAEKELIGADIADYAGKFTFVINNKNGDMLAMGVNTADGRIVFDEFTLEEGVHELIISEQYASPLDHITYDQNKYSVTVTVVNENGELKAEVPDGVVIFTNKYSKPEEPAPTPDPTPTPPASNPDTGDNANVGLWIALLGISLLVATAAVVADKRRRRID